MDLKLKNQHAFITGSTSGIGLAIARRLAGEGVRVTINGRSAGRVEQVVEELRRDFPDSEIGGHPMDLSDNPEMPADILKSVDILINNAGIFTSQEFEDTTDEDWYRLFEVNVMAGMRLSRIILPEMLKRDSGRIIFISSECAELVPGDLIAYSTTKAALHGLSRGLAQLTRGTGVTVNTVMPGSTLTGGAEKFLDQQSANLNKPREQIIKEFFHNERPASILARFTSPDEIASVVTYLVSPLASATNGAVIRAEGGSVPGIH